MLGGGCWVAWVAAGLLDNITGPRHALGDRQPSPGNPRTYQTWASVSFARDSTSGAFSSCHRHSNLTLPVSSSSSLPPSLSVCLSVVFRCILQPKAAIPSVPPLPASSRPTSRIRLILPGLRLQPHPPCNVDGPASICATRTTARKLCSLLPERAAPNGRRRAHPRFAHLPCCLSDPKC